MEKFKAYFMWFLALFFFAYQFVMRLFPGLVMQDVMLRHQVDASSFGLLSSFYYFGYAGMQIPVAYCLDRFGPRKVISFSALLCALATMVFAVTENWLVMLVARLMIGAGSACGFLGTSKVISLVFPAERYARMVGLSFSFGLLGALYGGKPTGFFVGQYGWESVGLMVGAVGLVSAIALWFSLSGLEKNSRQQSESQTTSLFAALTHIVRTPGMLVLAISNLLMVGCLEGFADVWGVSYLSASFGMEKTDAAFVTSCVFIGMLFGGPILAALSERFSYVRVTAFSGLLMALSFTAMLVLAPDLSYAPLCVLMIFLGMLCCYQVLVFAIGSKSVPSEIQGTTVAFLNCINMLGGSFFHLLIGSLLDLSWQGASDAHGLKLYSASDYSFAVGAIPLCALIGSIAIVFFVKQKNYCSEEAEAAILS